MAERIDDLQLKGLKIIQNEEWFCFGIDAVLLSNFVKVKRNSNIVEFGTGTGIIPILISGKSEDSHISAFEIQGEVAEMAARSVEMNGLSDRIKIVHDDLNNVLNYHSKASVDIVVTNPPYMSGGCGVKNPKDQKAISRHEIYCTLEDIISKSSQILKVGGALYMIHRPHRLVDISCLCRQYGMEPKEIRFIQPKEGQKPNIMLVKAVRGGKSELKFIDPLIVYNKDGSFTEEIYEIYGQERIDVFDKRDE